MNTLLLLSLIVITYPNTFGMEYDLGFEFDSLDRQSISYFLEGDFEKYDDSQKSHTKTLEKRNTILEPSVQEISKENLGTSTLKVSCIPLLSVLNRNGITPINKRPQKRLKILPISVTHIKIKPVPIHCEICSYFYKSHSQYVFLNSITKQMLNHYKKFHSIQKRYSTIRQEIFDLHSALNKKE